MKKQTKPSLKKITITNLDNSSLNQVRGGTGETIQCSTQFTQNDCGKPILW